MNDVQFESMMKVLDRVRPPAEARKLRARDTAQREALARVEAELSEEAANSVVVSRDRDRWRSHSYSVAEQRDTAQAQLAEAIKLLGWSKYQLMLWEDYQVENGFEVEDHYVTGKVREEVEAFLAGQDQAEQQEAPKRGKPDWNSHSYDQIFQTSDGNWFGARAGWDFKGHISDQWKGREVSLLRDDGGFLAYGEPNPDWESSLEQRQAQEAQGAQAGVSQVGDDPIPRFRFEDRAGNAEWYVLLSHHRAALATQAAVRGAEHDQ